MDVAFCLCTVIFIFYMDHASLVFRRCMCTLIVFLIFCNVFTWWYHVTLHCWRIYFFRPHTFCLDIDSIMTYILVMWLDIVGLLQVLHLRQNVFINHFTVLFVFAFSAFHSIRSRIFHPLHTGAAFSNLAFSTLLVYWCRVFRSRIFSRPQIRQTSGLIRIRIPDNFWLKFWRWRRFAFCECSCLQMFSRIIPPKVDHGHGWNADAVVRFVNLYSPY